MFYLILQNQAKIAYEELRLAPGLRPIMPQGAMYMMIEIKMSLFPEFKNELKFVERLVSEQSVFCLPGQVIVFSLNIINQNLHFYNLQEFHIYIDDPCSRVRVRTGGRGSL